jgi:aldehyde:ferredoxin oxidoreductase
MRVRGDNNPGTFSVEAMPNKPGWCLVRFYENAQEYTEELDETTITGWEYDEYHLEQPAISQEDIEGNLEVYLRAAKENEVTPESRLGDVEKNKADKQEVAAVWDSMAAAYQEGVQSV